jgi:cobalt/nickel transport system permease protein
MHIPDGFLDTKTALLSGAFSATGLGTALRHAGRRVQPRQIPLIGLAAAFIFVAQMINFPVAGGTSGHLLGATLAVVLLGPSAAVIVMASVIIIQALIFADGGVLAMGANIFNMALVAPLCSYVVYKLMRRFLADQRGQLISASIAAWCSTVAAAIFCAGELALSGTAAWNLAFPAMAGIHSLIGIGEAVITMLVLAAIAKTRPDLLDEGKGSSFALERKSIVVYGVVVILGLLVLVVPFASTLPDGLAKVAQSLGFEYRASDALSLDTPFKGYTVQGVDSLISSTAIAGMVGAIAVFCLSFLLARVLIPRGAPRPADSSHQE